MAIAPIWKDYFVTLGTEEVIPFRIRVQNQSGGIIYNGKSHIKPGETNNTIRINDICADYLTNALPALSQAEFSALSFPLNFVVETFLKDWTIAGQVQFMNDWSYDDSYNPVTMGLSFPINGRIDARQWLVFTAYNASTITATLTFTDGTTSQVLPLMVTDATLSQAERSKTAVPLPAALADLAKSVLNIPSSGTLS